MRVRQDRGGGAAGEKKLDSIGLTGYPKTTGGDGLHIYVPIEPHYTFDQARSFAEVIARCSRRSGPTCLPRRVRSKSAKRIAFTSTIYNWAKVKRSRRPMWYVPMRARRWQRRWPGKKYVPGLEPGQFTLANAMERFSRVGDLFEGVLKKPQSLAQAFGRLEKLLRRG